jgi:hypothetical protein
MLELEQEEVIHNWQYGIENWNWPNLKNKNLIKFKQHFLKN